MKISKAFGDIGAEALYEEGVEIMVVSKEQCPVDSGDLRRSGYVKPPVPEDNDYRVELGYHESYALPVHERTEVYHKPPTKARFLADPYNAALQGIQKRLAIRIKHKLKERGLLK
jgi:hypothetical protein